VTFPNQTPQTVSGPTDAEIAQYAASKGNGFWVTLLEKAYGRIQAPDAAIPNEGADTAIGGTLAGGDRVPHRAQREHRHAGPELARDHRGAPDRGIHRGPDRHGQHPRKAMPWTNGRTEIDLPMGHAYSVTGWDAASEVLTIRNPWGHGERNDDTDTTDDGTFTMSLDEFMSNFTLVGFEQGE
jgi:hypothetical protein